MKKDFVGQLKNFIKKLDEAPKVEAAKVCNRLYNIHKRSLPVGIDKIVAFNLTKLEAIAMLEGPLKARIYTHDDKDSKTLIYYDIIPVDATPREKSIYHNSGEIIHEF